MNDKQQAKERVSGPPRLFKVELMGLVPKCPGCHYSLVERAILDVLEEMGLAGQAICVAGVGCDYVVSALIHIDAISTAHGYPPTIAGVMKRIHPHNLLFTIQGDGDCMAIGAGPIVNAVSRVEKITAIMVNNSHYAMTGGQLAPTTLLDQVTTTTPTGRDPSSEGFPVHAAELMACIRGTAFSARTSVHTPANYQRTKRYLKTAFQKQMDNIGFTFIEVLSACPTGWRLSPVDALNYIEEKMIPEFPLGEFKNVDRLD